MSKTHVKCIPKTEHYSRLTVLPLTRNVKSTLNWCFVDINTLSKTFSCDCNKNSKNKKEGVCAISCYCKKQVLCNKHFLLTKYYLSWVTITDRISVCIFLTCTTDEFFEWQDFFARKLWTIRLKIENLTTHF